VSDIIMILVIVTFSFFMGYFTGEQGGWKEYHRGGVECTMLSVSNALVCERKLK
jgi:hypothetical protein